MEHVFEVAGDLRVDCRLPAGQLRLVPGPAGHARVELTPHGAAGEELINRGEVRLEEAGRGRQHLVVHLPAKSLLTGMWSFGGRGSVTVTVHCPPGVELHARTGAVDVHAAMELAAVDVVGGSGEVALGEVTGPVSVKAGAGHVRADRVTGSLDVDTGAGSVHVADVAGGARIRTASGAIDLGRAAGQVRITAAAGDVAIGQADPGQLAVTATTGNVDIGVPPGLGLHLDLSSTIGKVRSELDAAPDGVAGGPDGAAGGPDLTLRVRSTTGDVTLRRAAASTSA